MSASSCRHEKCLYCSEIQDTWQNLQLCNGVRSQTICVRKLGSWLRRNGKQNNACEQATKTCIGILTMFAFGQEDPHDALELCLPLANSVQTVALRIIQEFGVLEASYSSWFQVMECHAEYPKVQQPKHCNLLESVLKKLRGLLRKVMGYVKCQSPRSDLFCSILSSYLVTNQLSSSLWSQVGTRELRLNELDVRFISVLFLEFSSRSLILYPFYRKESDGTDAISQLDISIYENDCCLLWLCLVILCSDILEEYYSVFYYEDSSQWNISKFFFSGTSLSDANDCIESAMKLLRLCLWIALSVHFKFHIHAIRKFINANDQVRTFLRALAVKLEWFISQERNPRDSILAASFSWLYLNSPFWWVEDKETEASLNSEERFISLETFDKWMTLDLPNFSKLSICMALMEYCCDYLTPDEKKLSSKEDSKMSENENVPVFVAIFKTLKGFCGLGEDSHFHFVALDALRRCIQKLMVFSVISADWIKEVLEIIWQRCQEPIRGVSNQMNNIIQDLLSLSSRVSVGEQQRIQVFWDEFYRSLLSETVSTKAQFVIIESLLYFMGGSTRLLELSPNFPKQALLALSTDQSCSTSAAHCLETFWKLLLEQVGEDSFIEKTKHHLLESILEATGVLQEERLISQALGVYLKIPKDGKHCLSCLLKGISDITKDYWQSTRLRLIIISNGTNIFSDVNVEYSEDASCVVMSEKECTVLKEELNVALSSREETCRFAVLECLCGCTTKMQQLDGFEARFLLQLMPWFLCESKPSASWRFLHIMSRLLKRLKHSIHADLRWKQVTFQQWERILLQERHSNVPQVDMFQVVELLERMYHLFFYHLVVSNINTFRQQNACRLVREWMLVCADMEYGILPTKLTQQLVYTYYISMLNGSEKLVKSISELLDFYTLDLLDMRLCLNWIWKVCFYHLQSIRSSHAECGAQILKLIFDALIKSNGYYLTEWRDEQATEYTKNEFCMSRAHITDPALACFYFFAWFLKISKAKFGCSIVKVSNEEESWLFGSFIVCKNLFQDGWMPTAWLSSFSVEIIRSNIIRPLVEMLSSCVMECLKGVGYVEPWIGVYLQSISNSSSNDSSTEATERDTSFQKKLMVGSFHCLKEIGSLIATIIETVSKQKPVEKKKAQPGYVSKGLRRTWDHSDTPDELWTIEDIEYLFSLQIEVLCCTTHSGVMECVGDSLLRTCNVLFCSSPLEWSELPRKKLFQVLSELSNDSKFYSLRRSAGLPYFIRAVCLAAEQARLKDITPKVLHYLVDRVDSDDENTEALVIHCMNILQFLLQDGSLSDATMSFAEECFIKAKRAYASSKWSIRNSAMLLAGASLRRMLKVSGETRERDYTQFMLPVDSVVFSSTQVENETSLTFGEFFAKQFPRLFSDISASLRQAQGELLRMDTGFDSNSLASIYPILCLFSTLHNSKSNSAVHRSGRHNVARTNLLWNKGKPSRLANPFCCSHEVQLLPSLIEIFISFLQAPEQCIRLSSGNCLCHMVSGTPWSLQLWFSLLESLPLLPINILWNLSSHSNKVFKQCKISRNVIHLKYDKSRQQQRPWNSDPLQLEYSYMNTRNHEEIAYERCSISFSPSSTTEQEDPNFSCFVADIYLLLPSSCRGCHIQRDCFPYPRLDIDYDNEARVFQYDDSIALPCEFQLNSLSSIQNMLQGKLFTCIKLFQENVCYWTEALSSKEWLTFLNVFVMEYLSWIAVSVSVAPLTRSMWFTWMYQLLKILNELETIQNEKIANQLILRIHTNSVDWIFQVLFLEYEDFVTKQQSCADGLRFGQTQLVIECLRLLEVLDQKWLFSLDNSSLLSSLSLEDSNRNDMGRKGELLSRLPSLLDSSCIQVQRAVISVLEKWSKYWLTEDSLDRNVTRTVLKELGMRLELMLDAGNNTSPNDLVASVLHFYRCILVHIIQNWNDTRMDCADLCRVKWFLQCISSSSLGDFIELEWINWLQFRTKQIIERNSSYTVLEEAVPLYATALEFQYKCGAKDKISFMQTWQQVEYLLAFVETSPQVHPVPFRMAMLESLFRIGYLVFKKTSRLETFSELETFLKCIWVRLCVCIMQFLQDEYPDVRDKAANRVYDILKEEYALPECYPNWFQALDWIFTKCLSLENIMTHDEIHGRVLCHSLVDFIRKTLFLSFQVTDCASDYDLEDVNYDETHPSNVMERSLNQWKSYFQSTFTELFDNDPNNSFEEPLLQMQHAAVLCRRILVSSYGHCYAAWRRRCFEICIERLCFLFNWVLYMEDREMIGFLPEFFRPIYILLLHFYVLDEGYEAYVNEETRTIPNGIRKLHHLSQDSRFGSKIHKCLADSLKNLLTWHFGGLYTEAPQNLLFLLGKNC